MSSSGRGHVGSLFTNEEQERGGSERIFMVPLPHMSAMFYGIYKLSAGHKMEALTVVFLHLKRRFLTNRTRNGVKNDRVYIFYCIPFLSIGPVMLIWLRSPLVNGEWGS